MDPQKYSSRTSGADSGTPSRKFLKGSSKGSESKAFNVSKYFLRDSTTGEVSDVTSTYATSGPLRPSYNAITCTVENYVSEVHYEVFFIVN